MKKFVILGLMLLGLAACEEKKDTKPTEPVAVIHFLDGTKVDCWQLWASEGSVLMRCWTQREDVNTNRSRQYPIAIIKEIVRN